MTDTEATRLTSERDEALARATVAEASLAAIRDRGAAFERIRVRYSNALQHGYSHDQSVVLVAGWVVNGDATNTPETTDDSERLWPEAYVLTHPHPFEDDGTGRGRCGKFPNPETWVQCGFRREDHAVRYPCSATCTHDDAATPGHPERVKERSEAVLATAASLGDTADGIAELSEDDQFDGESDAYDRGAEDMRAACWELVQTEMRLHGWGPGDGPWTRLKAAIEGAAP